MADYNAHIKGMTHLAVLDLEKAYDRVGRRKRLHVATKWIPGQLLDMVRCLLGPLIIQSKGDTTNQKVQMTRGGSTRDPLVTCTFQHVNR